MNYLWLVFGLLSAVTASLVAVFGKIGLQGIDPNAATAIRAVIMAVFLFIVILCEGKLNLIPSIVANKKTFLFVILSGVAGASSWLFYFLALKFGKVGQVAPIDKLSVVLSTVLAVLFLGERLNKMNTTGVVVISIGVLIVALS